MSPKRRRASMYADEKRRASFQKLIDGLPAHLGSQLENQRAIIEWIERDGVEHFARWLVQVFDSYNRQIEALQLLPEDAPYLRAAKEEGG